jgi:metal-responsive CopG/Arc/MetJ family transcriptional regulator
MRQIVDHATKFQKLVQFRAPESLTEAINSAASKHLQSRSEYVRRSIIDRLKADGIDASASMVA